MNYTKSNSYTEHAGTGQRMHDAAKAIPTQVSDSDLNMIIWSLMEVIKDAGLQGVDFSADNPDSYKQLLKAIQRQRNHGHSEFVKKSGDTMTGPLVLHPLDASDDSNNAASTSFVRRLFQSFAPLLRPIFVKQDTNLEGGEIRLQAADNQAFGDLSIDYHGNYLRFFASHKSGNQNVVAAIDLSRIGASQTIDLMPQAGSILVTAAGGPPIGYLHANGAAVSRNVYPHLFAAIGTRFGAGDGSTTFNLPDLRGEFIRGWDNGRGADPGRAMGSWQGGQNQWHQHPGTTSTSGEHSHAVSIPSKPNSSGAGPIAMVDGSWNITGYQTYNTVAAGNHTHTFTTSGEGGSEARPRNVALLMCIKY